MADYSQYGIPSPEWLELLRNGPPAPTTKADDQTVEELQQATNASRETASAQYTEASGLQNQVEWTDFSIPTRDGQTIPARVYRDKKATSQGPLPVYLYFHGGGFLFGTLSSEDASCARVVTQLPVTIVNVCYRHTPDFKHPTQAHDAWDAFEWVNAHMIDIGGDRDQLIVGGVSAGAALAACVTLRENHVSQGKGRILGQVLCIPWLCHPDVYKHQMAEGKGSYAQNRYAPVLPWTQVDMFTTQLGANDPNDRSMFAGSADDMELAGLPRSAVIIAGMDPLRDEALVYEERLRSSGVPTKLHVFPGLPHGFYRYNSLPATAEWFKVTADSLRWILK